MCEGEGEEREEGEVCYDVGVFHFMRYEAGRMRRGLLLFPGFGGRAGGMGVYREVGEFSVC